MRINQFQLGAITGLLVQYSDPNSLGYPDGDCLDIELDPSSPTTDHERLIVRVINGQGRAANDAEFIVGKAGHVHERKQTWAPPDHSANRREGVAE